MYSQRYSQYLINLEDYLSKDHIALYSSGIASETCRYNKKWVGLPINIEYNVLYSNTKLLEQYGKTVPKTWKELLETGKFISQKEKEKEKGTGDDELIIYNGLFPKYETSMISTRELIYSFRKKKESPFPEYSSQEAVNALNMIKKIKEELASDIIFQNTEVESIARILTGKALFIKFWYMPFINSIFKTTVLVGDKEGISASGVGGSNVGIFNRISEKRKKAAIEFLKFATSKETQKKLITNSLSYSAINSLYDDKEVCKFIDCELMKNIQPIIRPTTIYNNYDEYSTKFQNLFFEFLYENRSATDVLNDIYDLTHIYYVPFGQSTIYGEGVFIIAGIILLIIISTIPFFFIHKYKPFFQFLSLSFWLITILGLLLHLGAVIINYGELTKSKCQYYFMLLSFGFTFQFIPIFHKLIINYPNENKYSNFIRKKSFLFLLCFIIYDIITNILFLIMDPFRIESIIKEKGKNFNICKINNALGKNLLITTYIEKGLIFISMLFLLHKEWNMWETLKDVKHITAMIIGDTVLYIFYIISITLINDYIAKFLFSSLVLFIFTILNYILIYGVKIIQIITNDVSDIMFIEELSKYSKSTQSNISSDIVGSSCESKSKISLCSSKMTDEITPSKLDIYDINTSDMKL